MRIFLSHKLPGRCPLPSLSAGPLVFTGHFPSYRRPAKRSGSFLTQPPERSSSECPCFIQSLCDVGDKGYTAPSPWKISNFPPQQNSGCESHEQKSLDSRRCNVFPTEAVVEYFSCSENGKNKVCLFRIFIFFPMNVFSFGSLLFIIGF